jgi:hypothetical protein
LSCSKHPLHQERVNQERAVVIMMLDENTKKMSQNNTNIFHEAKKVIGLWNCGYRSHSLPRGQVTFFLGLKVNAFQTTNANLLTNLGTVINWNVIPLTMVL